jgi:cobalt/nickel transport system permease protein
MVSRGYQGRMPGVWLATDAATTRHWLVAATVPLAATGIAATAVVLG